MLYEGERFLVTKRIGDYTYFYCAKKRNFFCRGSIKVHIDGTVSVIRPHNGHGHVEDNRRQFRNILIRRALEERTSCKVIYDEEAARDPESARDYTYATAQSSMMSARRRHNPVIPGTLRDLGALLENPEWAAKFHCTLDNNVEPFFREVIEVDDSVCLLFASQRLLDVVVAGVREMHLDGTFKCVPAAPHSHQLLTIHCVVENKTIPVAYSLMSDRRQTTYSAIFRRFRELAPTLEPELIITDYERALRGSLAQVYPNASVVGCYFHYANAVWKMAARLGLITQVHEDDEARKAIKLLMALALLPAHQIVDGVAAIRNWCRDNHILNFGRMFEYIQRFWIQIVTPEGMSVYGLPRRTNNNVESFNKILKLKMGIHPNVFVFVEKLLQINTTAYVNFRSLERGLRISRPINNKYLANDVRIRDAERGLAEGRHTIFHFLEIVSYTMANVERDLHEAHARQMLDEIILDDEVVYLIVEDDPPPPVPALLVDALPPGPEPVHANPEPAPADPEYAQVDPLGPEPAQANLEPILADQAPANPEPAPVAPQPAPGDPEHAAADPLGPEPAEANLEPALVNPELAEAGPEPAPAARVARCSVCLAFTQPTHAFLPCGHLCSCRECAERLGPRCPICRGHITSIVQIFVV